MSEADRKPTRTWQEIAEEASHERDSDRLAKLTQELEQALDTRDKKPVQSEHRPSIKSRSRSSQ